MVKVGHESTFQAQHRGPGASRCKGSVTQTCVLRQRPDWSGALDADVSMAIVHALGLLCAHALYWLRMHGENRQHSIRTGPAGTVIGAGHQIHTTVLWAITQVCLLIAGLFQPAVDGHLTRDVCFSPNVLNSFQLQTYVL